MKREVWIGTIVIAGGKRSRCGPSYSMRIILSNSLWSMCGVSFTRHRLQGRIEGNIEKLRAEREKVEKQEVQPPPVCPESPPMPPAPMVLKRKRRLIDESEDVGSLVRKIRDEFDKVAEESGSKCSGMKVEAIAGRMRSRRNEDVVVEINQVKSKKVEYGKRTSPRFAKLRLP